MRKLEINVIFTGKYLYVWYALFLFIVGFMLFNRWQLVSVKEFDLIVFDQAGKVLHTERVSADMSQNQYMLGNLPIEKSFIPIK
jgi:hypothetical protein